MKWSIEDFTFEMVKEDYISSLKKAGKNLNLKILDVKTFDNNVCYITFEYNGTLRRKRLLNLPQYNSRSHKNWISEVFKERFKNKVQIYKLKKYYVSRSFEGYFNDYLRCDLRINFRFRKNELSKILRSHHIISNLDLFINDDDLKEYLDYRKMRLRKYKLRKIL